MDDPLIINSVRRSSSVKLRFLKLIVVITIALCSVTGVILGAISLHRSTSIQNICNLYPLTCDDQQQHKEDLFSFQKGLVVIAHPDDAETCAGGTIAKLVEHGVEIRYIVLTNGDKGTQNRSITPAELTKIRKEEQLRAAAVLGVASVDFIGFNDGELEVNNVSREHVTRFIRKYQPDFLITFNPRHEPDQYLWFLEHRDHRAAGQIALDCAYPTARDFLFYPDQIFKENLTTWDVKQVYLFSWSWDTQNPKSNFAIDVTENWNKKIDAIMQHKSQISNPMAEIAYLEDLSTRIGRVSGYKYAEWFTRVLFPA